MAAVFAMAVFVFITVLAIGILRMTDANSLNAAAELKRSQAEYIARSGLEIGMAALQTKHPTEGVTLCEKVMESVSDPSLQLKEGYSNVGSGNPKGDVISIKSPAGDKIGEVQIIVYSLTKKDAEPKSLSFEYLTGSPAQTETIDREKQANAAGVDKNRDGSWLFHVVAIGQTTDYEKIKKKYPMARQIMTAEISVKNPEVVKIYNGF